MASTPSQIQTRLHKCANRSGSTMVDKSVRLIFLERFPFQSNWTQCILYVYLILRSSINDHIHLNIHSLKTIGTTDNHQFPISIIYMGYIPCWNRRYNCVGGKRQSEMTCNKSLRANAIVAKLRSCCNEIVYTSDVVSEQTS